VHHRLRRRRTAHGAAADQAALHQHRTLQLFHTLWRTPALGLHPGPSGRRPEFGPVVAAVLRKFNKPRPVHGLRVDLEFRHRHLVGPAFVVWHQAALAGWRAQKPALRRQPHGLAFTA